MAITYQNRVFDSIAAFCREYNLKYPTVQKQIQKGWTIEEILNSKSSRQNPAAAKNNKPCSYAGISYPTITLAIESLGIPMHDVPKYVKKYRCPVEEAIEYTMDHNPQCKESLQPCRIQGKKYASRAEACLKYQVKYLTIKDKMHQNDMSFEDALLYVRWKNRQIAPYTAVLPSLIADMQETSELDDLSALLYDSLQKIGYTPKKYVCKNINLLQIKEKLNINMPPYNVYLLVRKDANLSGILELFVDDLRMSQNLSNDLLNSINEINRKLAGIQITWNRGKMQAFSVLNITFKQKLSVTLQKILNRFISNTAAAITALDSPDNSPVQTNTFCYVDGYLFSSVSQACKAMDTNYISAMSRIQRLKISPEEAIGNGKRSPIYATWHKDCTEEAESPELPRLFDVLNKCGYQPEKVNGWFCIQEALDESIKPEKIYLTVQKEKHSTSITVEFCIPDLMDVGNIPKDKILRVLSLQNNKFHGAAAILSGQKIQTHYAQTIYKENNRIALQLTLNRFIGTSGMIRENLKKLL